jgi:hypothetical protein
VFNFTLSGITIIMRIACRRLCPERKSKKPTLSRIYDKPADAHIASGLFAVSR